MLSLEDENRVIQIIEYLKRVDSTDRSHGLTISRQYWLVNKLKELNNEVKTLSIQLDKTEDAYIQAIHENVKSEEELDRFKKLHEKYSKEEDMKDAI